MPRPTPPFYRPLMQVLRAAGLLALAGTFMGALWRTSDGLRVTVAAFGVMLLGLALSFAWGLVYSWRTRGAEWGSLLMVFGTVGWSLLAIVAFVVARRPWGREPWDPLGTVATTALVCLALCFGPVLLRGRNAGGSA